MLITRISCALLITGAIAASPAAAQVQSAAVDQALSRESQAATDRTSPQSPYAIVGSWVGTVGDGNRAINSFTSDGIMFGSVQGEVSLALGEVLTPIHGVWTHLGGRQFSITTTGLRYDPQTGEFHGSVKIHVHLKINAAGDRWSGIEKVELIDADGHLIDTFPPGSVQFTRVKPEPFE